MGATARLMMGMMGDVEADKSDPRGARRCRGVLELAKTPMALDEALQGVGIAG